MNFGYTRGDRHMAVSTQRKLLIEHGITDRDVYDETGDFTIRTWLTTRKIRDTDKMVLVFVARVDRIATGASDWRKAVQALHARRGVLVDASTGERSDRESDLLKMFQRASLMYAGKWLSPERAAEIGREGAQASPVTKKKIGRMPWRQVVGVMNNHKLTVPIAVATINADKRFTERWSKETIYRENRDPDQKLKLRGRMTGFARDTNP